MKAYGLMHQHTLSHHFWTVIGAHALPPSEYELGFFYWENAQIQWEMDGVWSTAHTIEGAISEKAGKKTAFRRY